jgi:hypothetical protein
VLEFSPVRTADQTACPEETPARAGKVSGGVNAAASLDRLKRQTARHSAMEGKMNSGSGFPESAELRGQTPADRAASRDLPAAVRRCMPARQGIYDAHRLRSQRDVIRDVMLAAADCDTWLTLAELRALTQYGEASISAQLRHLRKSTNGGYVVIKRRREDATPAQAGEYMWEYRIERNARAADRAEVKKSLEMCEA